MTICLPISAYEHGLWLMQLPICIQIIYLGVSMNHDLFMHCELWMSCEHVDHNFDWNMTGVLNFMWKINVILFLGEHVKGTVCVNHAHIARELILFNELYYDYNMNFLCSFDDKTSCNSQEHMQTITEWQKYKIFSVNPLTDSPFPTHIRSFCV